MPSSAATASSTASRRNGSRRPAALSRRRCSAAAAEKTFSRSVIRRHVGHHLELGAILQDLRQPPMRQGLRAVADHLVDLRLDLAAGHAHALAEDQQEALGDLQPVGVVAVEIAAG